MGFGLAVVLAHPGLSFALLSGLWVMALYWRALGAPLIYDDLDQIVNNPALGSLHATFHRFWLRRLRLRVSFAGLGGSDLSSVVLAESCD